MRWLRGLFDNVDWRNCAINIALVGGAGAVVWGVSDIHCGVAKMVFGVLMMAAAIIGGMR